MTVATKNQYLTQNQSLEALYLDAEKRLDALKAERANRIAADPGRIRSPEERDRELVWLIYNLIREFNGIKARHLSARGEYLFVGCGVGEHKRCRREIKRDGALLVCCCSCHKPKEEKK